MVERYNKLFSANVASVTKLEVELTRDNDITLKRCLVIEQNVLKKIEIFGSTSR